MFLKDKKKINLELTLRSKDKGLGKAGGKRNSKEKWCKESFEGGIQRICSRRTNGGIRRVKTQVKAEYPHVPFHSLETPESKKACLNVRAICRNLQAWKCTHARCLRETNQPLFSAPVNCLPWPNTCWTRVEGADRSNWWSSQVLLTEKNYTNWFHSSLQT